MGLQPEHPKTMCRQLLQEMQRGIYAECEKLPRETLLSEELGISRTQLRDVLAELEREGFITRRHGVGTMINRHVLQVNNRMDIETEFLDIIRHNGYTPDVSHVNLTENQADEYIAQKLHIPEGTEVVSVCKICTADGKPAIYCEDVLEKRFVTGKFTLEDLKTPIFCFLRKFCDIDTYMDLTEIHAVSADDKVSEALNIPVGTPLLNMEEVDFDIDGNAIFYSSQYFVDELFAHTVLRKKL